MVRILTDSTADLTHEDAAELGVIVVPLTLNFGEKHYLDGIDLTPEEFFEQLESAEKLPTTSQPTPEAFLKEFEAARDAGDEMVCVLLSSALSGTYQSAVIAREEADYDGIYLVDSKNVTLASQLLVRRAVDLARSGMSAAEIAEDLEKARERVHLFALVDTLKYLHKGGRLSGAAAIAGGLLGIKPVISINAEGKLALTDKARGLPGAYVAIFKQIGKVGGIDERYPVMLGYTGRRAAVEPFIRYITQNLHLNKPVLRIIGSVVGTHAGPGACGIAFFSKEEE